MTAVPKPAPAERARVNSYITSAGVSAPIELAYDVFGSSRGRPLVLIMGIGAQRIFWDQSMCDQLVDTGFQVVRFDHRDIGESTHLEAATPKPFPLLARSFVKLPITNVPYSLSDMANDVVGLLDVLGWPTAHVVGASLGGMIAQHLAIEHPSRLRSLTSIMSTPGGRRYLPKPHALKALLGPRPKTIDEAGQHVIDLFSIIGSTAWVTDTSRLREIGRTAFARGMNPRGFMRQFAAVGASGDRRPKLPQTQVPTLVIHGSRDPMFPASAGRKLASLVPNGTWLPITGMGHDLPPPLWPTLVRAIARHAERAEAH